ncbi:amidohydrolase family protein [Poritiphilus flavus]|uniref:Amidohydrolase family protein n=1 Tax=Poritiphilus flavus TaxID=2697053 RepID=A0A6L9ECM1_9FLAO|nr:amidohydrolase family protein [Poritiphilus flavus]NAS12288.1 amidohydrolase family protein [Poritiphilus flavus]
MKKTLSIWMLMILGMSFFFCTSTPIVEVDLLIKAGTLFDAQSGEVVHNKAIIVDQGRIIAIEDLNKDLSGYKALSKIDATDKFVMPALFDTHSHVTAFVDTIGTKYRVPTIKVFADEQLSKWHLRAMLYQGITNIRELGGFPKIAVNLKKQERIGEIKSPRILACSKLMSESPLIFPEIVEQIHDVEDARNYVKEMKKLGVDYIKLLFNLRPEFSKAAIDEAHKLNLKVAGHIKATTWREAIDMKIDALVHTPYGNDPMMDLSSKHVSKVLNEMAKKGIPNDPTLAMRYGYFEDPFFEQRTQLKEVYDSAPQKLKAMWQMLSSYKSITFSKNPAMAEYHFSYVQKAHDAGVVLSTSSDTWTSWADYGNTIHNEMFLLSKAGIPNKDVLMIATKNGAYQLHIQNDYGTVEKGKVADLLILRKNPLTAMENTRTIDAVIKNGKIVDRKKLLKP